MSGKPEPLSSRERVRRAMSRQDHDRAPRFDQFWPETRERFAREGFEGDLADVFGFDIAFMGYLAPSPFPHGEWVVEEDRDTRVTINRYGAKLRYWKNRSGTPEHLGAACVDRDIWRRDFKHRYNVNNCPPPLENIASAFGQARERDRYATLCGRHVFCSTQSLLSDETFFMAMASEPAWIRDIAQTFTDHLIAMWEAVLDAGIQPDAVWCFDDLAYTQAPFMSIPMYRDLFLPSHQRTVEWAHAHDMAFILHTDGDVRSFMPDFVDAGVDCLQPLEAKASMDLRELAPMWGDRISFFGNVDMMQAIDNDKDRIEAELIAKLAAGMERKGYLYHSDHSVPPQVSLDTYRHMIRLLDKHGVYA